MNITTIAGQLGLSILLDVVLLGLQMLPDWGCIGYGRNKVGDPYEAEEEGAEEEEAWTAKAAEAAEAAEEYAPDDEEEDDDDEEGAACSTILRRHAHLQEQRDAALQRPRLQASLPPAMPRPAAAVRP